jgi:hypothetical protein
VSEVRLDGPPAAYPFWMDMTVMPLVGSGDVDEPAA